MISDGVNCLFRHSVHGVWGDQLGDVEGVRVIGVLHAGGSPQRALDPGAVDLEGPITIAVFEDLPVGGIGQAGIGDTGLAAQFERLPRADSVQPLVDFGVHPGDEKRCHRMDLGQAVSGLPGLFHPGQVGVHHLAVPLHGEDQRNVDRNPFRQNGTDGGQTGLSGRDLDEKVRPVDDLPQLDCLLDRFFGFVCQPRVDLDRHPAVDPVGVLPLGDQHVARAAHVVSGDGADGGIHVGAARGQLGDLGVVGVALRQRLLKDRRVGGHPDDALGVDQLLQIARAQPVPRQVIQPHRYPRGAQCGQVGVLSGHR